MTRFFVRLLLCAGLFASVAGSRRAHAQGTNTVRVSADVVAPEGTTASTSMAATNVPAGTTTTVFPSDPNSAMVELTGAGQSVMSVQFMLPTTMATADDSLALAGWAGLLVGEPGVSATRSFDPRRALTFSFGGRAGEMGQRLRLYLGADMVAALQQRRGRYLAIAQLTAYFTEI